MKVTLKQLPETVLKNSCPLNSMSLKKHLFPNSTMEFVDVLRKNKKLVSSVCQQKGEYCNIVSVSSRTNT